MLTGGCFCGTVRYAAEGDPSNPGLCHCTTCRGTTGAPVVGWFTVPVAAFRFTSGEPRAFQSSSVGVRRFCETCGTMLTFNDSRHEGVDITMASLDDPAALRPVDHIWVSSRLPWMTGLDALPDLLQGHCAPPPDA